MHLFAEMTSYISKELLGGSKNVHIIYLPVKPVYESHRNAQEWLWEHKFIKTPRFIWDNIANQIYLPQQL